MTNAGKQNLNRWRKCSTDGKNAPKMAVLQFILYIRIKEETYRRLHEIYQW